MIFDRLAMAAERHLPHLKPLLEQSKMFVFPGRAHEVLPKEHTPETIEFLQENFFLPFPVVVVEDTASCVLLFDSDSEQRGLGGERKFIEVTPLDGTTVGEVKDIEEGALTLQIDEEGNHVVIKDGKSSFIGSPENPLEDVHFLPKGTSLLTMGTVHDVSPHNEEGATVGMNVTISLDAVFVISKQVFRNVGEKMDETERELTTRETGKNIHTAYEEVMYFNTPNRFVVETQSTVKRKIAKGRVPRSNQRPSYILLTPGEIRTTFGISRESEDGKKVRVHERRRHYRTLKSDRYKEKKGQTIVIPATWVGKSEAVVKNKKYRVCLDI